jgi:hypothetical protein
VEVELRRVIAVETGSVEDAAIQMGIRSCSLQDLIGAVTSAVWSLAAAWERRHWQ